NRRAAGVHHRYYAVRARHGDIGRVFVRRGEIAKTRFGEPHAFALHLGEIGVGQSGLEDDRAGVHAHAARPVALEGFVRGDGERLDAGRVARPPRHVHLRGADARRDATVNVAFEESDRLLPRRVIAERDVNVRVD